MFNAPYKKISLILFLTLIVYLIIIYAGTIISLVLPLMIAIIIAYKIRPLIKFLDEHTPLPIAIISLLSVILSIGCMMLIVWVLSIFFTSLSTKIIAILPQAVQELNSFYQHVILSYKNYFTLIPTNWQGIVSNSISSFSNQLIAFVGSLAGSLMNRLSLIPNILLFFVFTLLTTYFVTKDFEHVDYFIRHGKDFLQNKILYQEIKKNVFIVLIGYLRAQLILMSCTFIISLIGLLILRVDYAPLIAFTIALVDALPMFGPAIIYIPWMIARILVGNASGAIGLFILYLIATLTRQTMEPKIVSSQIGIHPIVTLSAMYAGVKLFGVLGIILGPLSAIIITKSYKILTSTQKHEH